VQIGAVTAQSLTLDARVLRHSSIEMLGCSVSNVSPEAIACSVSELIRAASVADFAIETAPYPLERIRDAWSEKIATPRIVFTPSRSPHR
jgi:hypothetical protein